MRRDFEQFARRMRLIYFFTGKTENHILFMLNQLGCPRFNTLLLLRATSLYSSWKIAKLTLIFKKDDATEIGNYRPISLLSIPNKIIESEVVHVFERHWLASDRLCAYRQGYSTEPLLVHRTKTFRKAVDSGLISYHAWTRQTKYSRPRCNSITESTSKRQWWNPRKKRLMTSLADYTEASKLTTWLRNGRSKLPFRLEYQYSTHLQKSTNLNR